MGKRALPINIHRQGGTTMKHVKKILVPLDLTQNSAKIIPFAVSFSEKLGSPISLLHVVQDLQKWGKLYVPHMSISRKQRLSLSLTG